MAIYMVVEGLCVFELYMYMAPRCHLHEKAFKIWGMAAVFHSKMAL